MRELRTLFATELDAGADRAVALFRETAVGAGLVDVAYAFVGSPIGDLFVAKTRRGLVRVGFPREVRDDVLEELAMLLSPRVLEAPAELDEIRRALEEYFEGRRRRFDVPVDRSLTRGFTRKVLQ